MAELGFAKYHGTGNDFVMLEDPDDERPLGAGLAAALCHRRFGVGADGVIRVTRAEDADFFMDYRNADGSTAEMCGNGIRCLGKLVYERGLTTETELSIATRGGVKHLSLHVDGGVVRAVTVGMGPAAFARSAIPMLGSGDEPFLRQTLEVDGRSFTASAVSMGNPHVVLLLDEDPEGIDVGRLGPMAEHHELFPQKTNVEFVRAGEGVLDVRVWERGVGETMACGTGACAALVATHEAGRVGRRGIVRFSGGDLDVQWLEDGEVLLTGPAERVYEGSVDPAWLMTRTEGAR